MTVEGRCVAIGMMVCGIALLGTITATIASWLVERVSAEEDAGQAATAAHMQVLADKIDRLEALLAQPARGSGAPSRIVQPPSNAGETVT